MSDKFLNVSSLLREYADDQDILVDIMIKYISIYPTKLEEIRNALAAKNGDDLRRAAHSLKGSISHFFVTDIFSDLDALENYGAKADFELAHIKFHLLERKLDSLNTEINSYVQEVVSAKSH